MSEHREFSPVTPESEKKSLVELSNNTVQETNEVLEMVSHDEIEKDVVHADEVNEPLLMEETVLMGHGEDEIKSNISDLTAHVDEVKEPLLIEELIDDAVMGSYEEEIKSNISDLTAHVDEVKEPLLTEEQIETVDDVKTLAAILQIALLQSDGLDKYSVTITPDVKNILAQLMEQDKYFDEFENALNEIIKDGKIDARDVPRIMRLLADLYTRMRTMKIEFNENTCGDVLKMLFNIALKEGLIKINDEDMELMQCVYSIVDMSIRLMQTDTDPSKRGGLLKCIKRTLFGKK
jgi:hypothetical protein